MCIVIMHAVDSGLVDSVSHEGSKYIHYFVVLNLKIMCMSILQDHHANRLTGKVFKK